MTASALQHGRRAARLRLHSQHCIESAAYLPHGVQVGVFLQLGERHITCSPAGQLSAPQWLWMSPVVAHTASRLRPVRVRGHAHHALVCLTAAHRGRFLWQGARARLCPCCRSQRTPWPHTPGCAPASTAPSAQSISVGSTLGWPAQAAAWRPHQDGDCAARPRSARAAHDESSRHAGKHQGAQVPWSAPAVVSRLPRTPMKACASEGLGHVHAGGHRER